MAINTTTQFAGITYTEHLAEQIMQEERPKRVALQLINHYSLAGKPTRVMKLNRVNDPGQATAGTEGTAFTTLTTVGTTSVSVTPTEGAIAQFQTTNDAVETRIPGMTGIQDLMLNGSNEQKVQALIFEARLGLASVEEKAEQDVINLYSSLSRSAGATGVNFSLANFTAALLLLETGEDLPHEDYVADLDKQQFGDLRDELMVTSGGVSGSLWPGKQSPSAAENEAGWRMDLLGVDIFTHGKGVRVTANAGADVVGALYLRGTGAPEDGGGGQYGCFAMVEGRPVQVGVEYSLQSRAATVQVNGKYAVAERNDNFGVAFITDA